VKRISNCKKNKTTKDFQVVKKVERFDRILVSENTGLGGITHGISPINFPIV